MAGGEGTRLRPLTSNQPKPMIPLANRPLMEHVLTLLGRHGFREVVVTVAFMANTIRTWFGDGSELGFSLTYVAEEPPLGTAGSVRNARAHLDETFLVISGDVVTDIDLSRVVEFHRAQRALATIALKSMEDPLEFGIVITRQDGSIERFLEKPTWGQVFSDTINTGVYVLEPGIFDHIPEGRPVDFSSEVFPALLAEGIPLYGYVADGYWEDVGTLEAYLRAHQDALDGRAGVELPGFRLEHDVWLGQGAEIDPSATVEGPAVIGDNCRIGSGAKVGDHTVLGSNVRVGPDAELVRSVVHDNTYLGPGVRLLGCVVGRSSDLRQGAHCAQGVVLGDDCFVGPHAVLDPGVKVYPGKTIEAGAAVHSSIVWESRASRHLFGRQGVAGLANVDISPELAVRLSMAYATTLPKGSTVTASRDTSRAARVLKRAIMVGLNAAGIHVDDLEATTVPVTRLQVRASSSRGGVSVRLAQGEPQSVVIRFFDDAGIDLTEASQRKIERVFQREDFRRSLASELGGIDFPARTLEYYTDALVASVDLASIQAAHFKLVLDYAYGTASFVMPNVLAKLEADVLALNPYGATARAMALDLSQHASEVGRLVQTSGAHLGAVLDSDGERLIIVDDQGRALSDQAALLALLRLVVEAHPGGGVALPVVATRAAEEICHEAGATIEWTKLATPHLMEVAASGRVAFAASHDGGFIFPAFLPAYDAAATLVNLLAMLAASGRRLSEVVDGCPPVHMAHRTVATPWECKGMVMRALVEGAAQRSLILVDGVKVVENGGWALVLPDPEEPVSHVWAEGETEEEAHGRAGVWADRLRSLLPAK
jgi:mannose-1-phosphate guanylyltransferase/phosphomannomutase